MGCRIPGFLQSLLRLMSTESLIPSNHLIFCHPLLLCLHSFPASGSFPVSQLFSGGQSIGVSASASIFPHRELKLLNVHVCSVVSNSAKPCHFSPPGSSEGFSRQEYWSGLPFPPPQGDPSGEDRPGDLSNPGIEFTSPAFLAFASGLFITESPGFTYL